MTDPSPGPGARPLGAWVAGLCEDLGPRLSPAAGGQVQVARLVAAGEVELPERMAGELLRLALSDDPAWVLDLPGAGRDQLAVAAQQAAARWRDHSLSGAAPPQARAALVAHRGLYVLLQRLRGAR